MGFSLLCFSYWPTDPKDRELILNGLQKVAFASGAFAVTAYNLRTRVVDFVLKAEGRPDRVRQFCAMARNCGKRLTHLVVGFTATTIWLSALSFFDSKGSRAAWAASAAVAMFVWSIVSFLFIIFAFERLERFALDEAESNSDRKEAARLKSGK